MFETMLTVVGNVVDDPTIRSAPSGAPVSSFRLASTSRRFDRESERYVDGPKVFLTVSCWNDMADNVHRSLHKGQSIVVFGRLATREYVKDEQARVNYELTAEAIGHNLARGHTDFTRSTRTSAVTSVATDADGLPPDATSELLSAEAGSGLLVGAGAPPF